MSGTVLVLGRGIVKVDTIQSQKYEMIVIASKNVRIKEFKEMLRLFCSKSLERFYNHKYIKAKMSFMIINLYSKENRLSDGCARFDSHRQSTSSALAKEVPFPIQSQQLQCTITLSIASRQAETIFLIKVIKNGVVLLNGTEVVVFGEGNSGNVVQQHRFLPHHEFGMGFRDPAQRLEGPGGLHFALSFPLVGVVDGEQFMAAEFGVVVFTFFQQRLQVQFLCGGRFGHPSMIALMAVELQHCQCTLERMWSHFSASSAMSFSSFMMKTISNRVRRGMESPVLLYRSRSLSQICPGRIGLHAPITVVRALSFVTTEALAELMVCCSIDSSKDFSSFFERSVNQSMQQTPLSASISAPASIIQSFPSLKQLTESPAEVVPMPLVKKERSASLATYLSSTLLPVPGSPTSRTWELPLILEASFSRETPPSTASRRPSLTMFRPQMAGQKLSMVSFLNSSCLMMMRYLEVSSQLEQQLRGKFAQILLISLSLFLSSCQAVNDWQFPFFSLMTEFAKMMSCGVICESLSSFLYLQLSTPVTVRSSPGRKGAAERQPSMITVSVCGILPLEMN